LSLWITQAGEEMLLQIRRIFIVVIAEEGVKLRLKLHCCVISF